MDVWQNSGCSAGTLEYQCVDEGVPADVSDYLYMSTLTSDPINYTDYNREVFNFENLPPSAESVDYIRIYYYGVERIDWVMRDGMVYRYVSKRFRPVLRTNSVQYLDAANPITLGSTYGYQWVRYDLNPVTGDAWTVSEVNALKAGMSGSFLDHAGGNVAQIMIQVSYHN
jgi:hypothetical protein